MERASGKRKVGLVLSGGGARGFAHIGVFKMLEEAGIEADVVAGTSMGAILGAFYAAGYDADTICDKARRLSWRDVLDLSLQAGFIKGGKLHQFLADALPKTFRELKKPLAITTTDIESGEEVILTEGDLITALRASSCYPGAFEPVQYRGRTLADGGIVNNLPVEALSFLDATYTIASDATSPRRSTFVEPHEQGNWWERFIAAVRFERRTPMAQMVMRSSDIMQSILTEMQYSLHPADVRVRHLMPEVMVESFWRFEEIIEASERNARLTFEAAGLLQPSPDKVLKDGAGSAVSVSTLDLKGRASRVD